MSDSTIQKQDKDIISCRPADIWQIFKIHGPNSASLSLKALDAFSARKHAEASRLNEKRKEESAKLATCHEEITKLKAALAAYEGGSSAKKVKSSKRSCSP